MHGLRRAVYRVLVPLLLANSLPRLACAANSGAVVLYASIDRRPLSFTRLLKVLANKSDGKQDLSWERIKCLKEPSRHEVLAKICTFIIQPETESCPVSIDSICDLVNSIPADEGGFEATCSRDVSLLRSGEIVQGNSTDGSTTDPAFLYPSTAELAADQKRLFDELDLGRAWRLVKNLRLPRREVTVAVLSTGAATEYGDLAGEIISRYNAVSRDTENVSDINGHGTAMLSIVDGIGRHGRNGEHQLECSLRGVNRIMQVEKVDVAIIPYVTESNKHTDMLHKQATRRLVDSGALVLVTAADRNMTFDSYLVTPCHLAMNKLGMLCVASTTLEDPTKLYSSSKHSHYIPLAVPSSSVAAGAVRGECYSSLRFRGGGAAVALVGGAAALMSSIGSTKPDPYDVVRVLIHEAPRGVQDGDRQLIDVNVTNIGRAVEAWLQLSLELQERAERGVTKEAHKKRNKGMPGHVSDLDAMVSKQD
ncbi:hypothetical protein FOZ61_001156 [Perkinsus olseni]|uniref:subtilisin n=1 Tax=Perkinsus olseni TaxID=32597 RepID=A0A7J6KSK3_PEROL|nr:hypothetical protein FOZ61_001156 [Perkinsus olseni]KAF4650323.1 hypothetical protein FOL46_001029 [Perkinsus olseni]